MLVLDSLLLKSSFFTANVHFIFCKVYSRRYSRFVWVFTSDEDSYFYYLTVKDECLQISYLSKLPFIYTLDCSSLPH